MRLIAAKPQDFLWGWSKGWQDSLICAGKRDASVPPLSLLCISLPGPPPQSSGTCISEICYFQILLHAGRNHNPTAPPPDPFFPKASYNTSQRWRHVAVLNTGPSCKGPASPQAFTPLPAPARSQNCPVQPQTLPKSLSATSRSTWIYLPIHLQHTPSTQHSNPATLGCLSATQHRGKGLVMGNFTFSSQIMVQMQATAGHLGLQGNFCVPCSQTTKLRHQERRKTVADGEGCKATAPKPAFRPFCQLQNNLHPYQSS